MPAQADDAGYWLNVIRQRTGRNSVTSAFADIADYLASGQADERALSGLHVALRSLSQEAHKQLSERREQARLARYRR